MEFKELIKDKDCVVVAPSGYMSERRHGIWIDSFDFVAKMNRMYLNTDKGPDLGERCDLLYNPPVGLTLINPDIYSKVNGKLLCFLPLLKDTWRPAHEEFLKVNNHYQFPYRMSDRDVYDKLADEVECVPLTGVFAVFDLLEHGAAKVYAVGFDFHRSGYGHAQFVDQKALHNGWHKTEPQMRYFWKLLQSEPRFDCDYNLKQILHEEFDPHYQPEEWLKKILPEELSHFCKDSFGENTLVFRSCTITKFRIMAEIFKGMFSGSISYVVQSSVKEDPVFEEEDIISYDSNEPLRYEVGIELLKRHGKSFTNCLIPYNGEKLVTYSEIIKIIRELRIPNVFLVSQRGIMKRMDLFDELCEELSYYDKHYEQVKILDDKYGRENII